MYFESHAHYDDKKFDEDRDELLLDLKNHNVGYVVNVGADMQSSHRSIKMAEKYDFVYASVGIHPHEAINVKEDDYKTLEKWLQHKKVKNANKLLNVVENIPLEAILIETDSPYLSPVPVRGTRNNSQNLKYVVQKISEIKQIKEEIIEKITLETSKKFFCIK